MLVEAILFDIGAKIWSKVRFLIGGGIIFMGIFVCNNLLLQID